MQSLKNKIFKTLCFVVLTVLSGLSAKGQQAYYIDGYHGGIWGHYPDWNTRFIVDMLNKHPHWKINLEIEPETWGRAAVVDPKAFEELKTFMNDQSANGRIEYVSPAYAQSYLYNIDGESIIRQFDYGMAMLKSQFPGIKFSTYSTEEPCFTSALPGILTSFGINYTSLKNPNTCFGGYTRAFGGELVNWIGPDGSAILTVPRYEVEKLQPKSTWQTIAWNNSPEYINAAVAYGIKHPIGMTLQDAGWKGGPFLGNADAEQQKNKYTTWRNYFENVVAGDKKKDWKLSQEDILVSLVWGSQVTQQLAQRVRNAENQLIRAEKAATIAGIIANKTWPKASIDSAWRTLMLAQHHDCWIVPYNGKDGDTWADKVVKWTFNSNNLSQVITNIWIEKPGDAKTESSQVTVLNTQAKGRTELVSILTPVSLKGKSLVVKDAAGKLSATQVQGDSLMFLAKATSFGYSTFDVVEGSLASAKNMKAAKQANGKYMLESDLYRIVLDPEKGGSIVSLVIKQGNKEMVDQKSPNGFNTMRGNFYNNGGLKRSSDAPAQITIIESGPLRASVLIKGKIAGTNFSQTVSLTKGEPVIDMHLTINWKDNVGVGEDVDKTKYKWTDYRKPFYNDSNKLVTVFPLNLKGQKVYKNAPLDVTESRLDNTFYNSWDSIKNTVILNWVDVTDANNEYGLALFTDHTTSYTHGENFPLGLVTQYSGMGLWGRNYTTSGPTYIHYAVMPHKGKWDVAGVWPASAQWNEPLIAASGKKTKTVSWLVAPQTGLTISAAQIKDGKILLRFFNAEGISGRKKIKLNFKYNKATLVSLNGRSIGNLLSTKHNDNTSEIDLTIPKFGFKTVVFE
ncbi:glycosyl hydrolase [Mucilaginibacter pallidiroseus]|uniref:Glycosyl hydrolase n=1 Tax=Mucilaginibacter pallidiroseus TaxID=2599295 RepID=A0A563U0A5_9SPHI|nr:glycoside hydrolase family 38 C-terminal domain-containing protein [Mucilaginibacter pallidiroseus]TWR24810.1 glycosyl hydrolase [Mucilaginibacter pallidiroseus]